MNEIFKKLLIEAINEVGPDDKDRGMKEATLQKFGEEIVKKCADLCTDSYYTPDGFGYTTADARCHDLILKHFGVQ